MKNEPHIAAVFDLDGTITCNDTYLSFLVAFLKHHPYRLAYCWSLPFSIILYKLKFRDNAWLKKKFLGAIAGGTSRNEMNSFISHFINDVVEPKMRQNALNQIEFHKESGHILILATASFDFYVEELGHRLGFDAIICTHATWNENNRLLGDISGKNCYAQYKLQKVIQHIENNDNINYTVAYTDHHSDLPLMEWVNEAIAVNPTSKLRRFSETRGYQIKSW